MLKAQCLNKSFGNTITLRDVSADFKPGEITALIGPNGCGKSTLLRALSLLDPPDSGTVIVDEVPYVFPSSNGKNITLPWPKLTMVFQQLFLWPHLTIRQNITLPLEMLKGECDGNVDKLIDLMEMKEYVDRYPNQVSLGQRQRASIARALALEPKYLLLDEITSALDVEQISTILEHLKVLRDEGTCIVLVTHLIGFAKSAADQIVFIKNGKIEESGTSSILTAPRTTDLRKFLSLLETGI